MVRIVYVTGSGYEVLYGIRTARLASRYVSNLYGFNDNMVHVGFVGIIVRAGITSGFVGLFSRVACVERVTNDSV